MNDIANKAIGVFDSGLGGLTAVSRLREILPLEDIIYFGDTARLPYGSRSQRTIIRYAESDLAFLKTKDVKAVLVACGTVSSNAMDVLILAEPELPIVGVLEASADAAAQIALEGNGVIVVLGTSATVGSKKYEEYFAKKYSELKIISRACPLFVPLVENKLRCGNLVKQMVANEYLSDLKQEKPSAVILGCTHYILLEEIISEIFEDSILVDSGEEAAKRLSEILVEQSLLRKGNTYGSTEYYVSDSSEEFLDKAVFLNDCIGEINLVDIENYI